MRGVGAREREVGDEGKGERRGEGVKCGWDGWKCEDEYKGKDKGMDEGEGKDVDEGKHEGWDGRTG